MAPAATGRRHNQKRQEHSLVFCPDCGSLLDAPSGAEDHVTCGICGGVVVSEAFESVQVVTKSRPDAFPDRPTMRKKLEEEESGDRTSQHLRDGATIKEKCPKCDAPEMVFHTAQLRSADEGQTVFYSCVKCGYVNYNRSSNIQPTI
ncbi:transcription factor S-II-domain-containing protein [Fimicolochytrium jonesii]|uniref:transcription factor S-II-domain-containing protein n=1 Tax=Fimicolochytrium jonesii TaxID=1396493 RepID=UPI0022FE85EB|nr:transcription factor S-II-domain-containing protein [Fimicolochytrium jonesii]KAI8816783.1 transcription factor S-II-domain-containing protein [Fimicolochytrium jonesii]